MTAIRRAAVSVLLALSCLFPAAAVAQNTDYSKGFEMLVKLGLPDTKGWKYVRIESYDRLQSSLQGWKRTGNSWVEAAPDADGVRRVVSDGITLQALIDADSARADRGQAEKLMKSLAARGLQPSWGGGRDIEGDEAADAASLVETLKAEMEKGENRSLDYLLRDPEVLSQLFFYAAHWHRRGLEKEASELVTFLLGRLPRKAALVEVAVQRIANQRQAVAVTRFKGSGDWAALQAELEKLLADFPRSWPERPLSMRLLEQVKTRVAAPAPPVAADGEFPLSPEQAAWWADLEKPKESAAGYALTDPQQAGAQWARRQLPWTEKEAEEQGWTNEALKGSLFDLSKDWDWIGLMAAGLGDATLVHVPGDAGYERGHRMSWGHELDSEPVEPVELEDEELEEAWRRMSRPQSRDGIARAFLRGAIPALPDQDYEWWETASVEEAKAAAKAWQEKLAGRSGDAVTQLYFEEGDDERKQWAATLMIRRGTEEEVAPLRELVLSAPSQGVNLAFEIVKRDKEKARPFFDAFRAKLREAFERDYGERSDKADIERQFENRYGQQFQLMENLLSGKGFAEIYAAFVAGEKDANAFSNEIQALSKTDWSQTDVETAFAGVLSLAQPTPERRGYALNIASYVARAFLEGEEKERSEKEEEDGKAADKVLPDWIRAAYEKIVAEGGSALVAMQGKEMPLSRAALYYYDGTVNPAATQEAMVALQGLPDEDIWALMEARGKARLAGETPPPVPTADTVPEARKAEIAATVAGIGGMDAAKWDAFVASLTVEERLVLRDALTAAEPDPSWKALGLRVGEVVVPVALAGVGEGWKALAGSAFDAALVERILELAKAQVDRNAVEGNITSLPLLGGLRIAFVDRLSDRFADSFRTEEPSLDFDAAASFEIFARGEQLSALRLRGGDGTWRVHAGQDVPGGLYGLLRGNALDEAEFKKSFESYLDRQTPGSLDGYFRFVAFVLPKPGGAAEKP